MKKKKKKNKEEREREKEKGREKEREEKKEAKREEQRKQEREEERKERKELNNTLTALLPKDEPGQKGVFQSFKDYFKNLPKNTKEGFQKGLINLPSNVKKGIGNGLKGVGKGAGKILGTIGENFLEGFFEMNGITNLMNLAETKKGNKMKKKGTPNDKILYNQLAGLKQLEDSMISTITENRIEEEDMKKFKLRNFKEILESFEGHTDTSYELLKNQTELTNNFEKLDTIFDFFTHENSLGIDKTEFDKEIETIFDFLKPSDKNKITNDATAKIYVNEVNQKKELINEFFLNTNPIKISLYKYLKKDNKNIYKITNTLMLLYREEIESYFDTKLIKKYYRNFENFSDRMNDDIKKLFLERVKKHDEEENKKYILSLLNKESEEPTSSTPPEKSESAPGSTSPTEQKEEESSTPEDDRREEEEIIKRKALLVAKTITILLSVKEITKDIEKKKKTFLNKLLYREDSFSQEYLLFLIILGNDFSKLNESLRESYLNDTTDNLYKFYNKLLNKFNRINNRIKPIKGEYDNIIGFFDYNKIIKYLLDKLSLKYNDKINRLSSNLFANIQIPAILNKKDLYYEILPKLEDNFKRVNFNNYIEKQILKYELRKIEDIKDEAKELEKIKKRMETLYSEFKEKCKQINTILKKLLQSVNLDIPFRRLQKKKVRHFIKLLENVIKRKLIEPFPFISVIGVFIDIDYINKTINNKIKKKDKTVVREIRKMRNTLDFLKITDKEFYNSLISDISEIEEKKSKTRKSKRKKYMKNIFENNSYITIIINILKNLLSTKNLKSLFHLNIINSGILSDVQDIDTVYLTKEEDKKPNNELKNKQYIFYFKDLIFNKIPSENEVYNNNTYGDYTNIIKSEVEKDRSIKIIGEKLTQKIKKNILYKKLEESITKKRRTYILDFLTEQIKSKQEYNIKKSKTSSSPKESEKLEQDIDLKTLDINEKELEAELKTYNLNEINIDTIKEKLKPLLHTLDEGNKSILLDLLQKMLELFKNTIVSFTLTNFIKSETSTAFSTGIVKIIKELDDSKLQKLKTKLETTNLIEYKLEYNLGILIKKLIKKFGTNVVNKFVYNSGIKEDNQKSLKSKFIGILVLTLKKVDVKTFIDIVDAIIDFKKEENYEPENSKEEKYSDASVVTQEQSQDIKASIAIVAKILNTKERQTVQGGSRKKSKKSKRNKRKIKYPRTKKVKKSKKKKTIEYINNKNYNRLSKKKKKSKKKKTLEYINNKNYLKLTKKK